MLLLYLLHYLFIWEKMYNKINAMNIVKASRIKLCRIIYINLSYI